jgi:hypothetical protein
MMRMAWITVHTSRRPPLAVVLVMAFCPDKPSVDQRDYESSNRRTDR